MPPRTFTVFQDASPVKKPSTIRPLGRSASAAAVLTTSSRRSQNHTTVSLPEKENLHPLTGTSLNSSASSGKKRKASESTSVLAPKVLGVASEAGGSAKSKPKRAELKRKASSQAAPSKNKAKKENSKKDGEARKPLAEVETTPTSTSTRKPGPRAGSRSVSTPVLATIKEEAATQEVVQEDHSESEAKSITQAQIDSRCYELTVSPLADVSGAYLQSSESKEESKVNEPVELRKEELDFAAQIRDYFLFDDSRLDSQPSGGSLASPPTPLFSEELDIFKTFDFVNFSFDGNSPKSAPATPKKSQRFTRSHSLPSTPTKKSIKKGADASPALAPLMLSTPERREIYATFTFTTPKSSTETL